MHRFKEMSQEDIRAVLDKTDESGRKVHQDILTPLIDREERVFKTSTCPSCGTGACSPTLDTLRPFTPDNPLPNRILRCTACGSEFDPYTRIVRLVPLTYARD